MALVHVDAVRSFTDSFGFLSHIHLVDTESFGGRGGEKKWTISHLSGLWLEKRWRLRWLFRSRISVTIDIGHVVHYKLLQQQVETKAKKPFPFEKIFHSDSLFNF